MTPRRNLFGMADKVRENSTRYSMSSQVIAFDENAKLRNFKQKGLIPKKDAQTFPQFGVERPVKSLTRQRIIIPQYFVERETPALLLTCGNRTLTQKLVDSWREMVKENHFEIPVYEVIIQEETVYRVLSPLFETALKWSLPKVIRPTVFHHYPKHISDKDRETQKSGGNQMEKRLKRMSKA
eukprot:TRINITY_DN2455_c0_g1_i3.p1 TRINITY_DN2455_c0_g1~~TRINITY_DN2455_c0_g1_i3.p1  ORF type:complete len:182 (-),score=51.89 TRINITY_DN2455_c0_g1_i3:214-759(-)